MVDMVVGKFGAPYGIKGWLKINSFTENPDTIFDYVPWYIKSKGIHRDLNVADWRYHGKSLIAKLNGYDDREAVEQLKNCLIEVNSEQLPALGDDEFYWRELITMEVFNQEGYHMGRVSEVMETGANDVLRVKANGNDAYGQQERLIPFIMDSYIVSVDRKSKRIVVDWQADF